MVRITLSPHLRYPRSFRLVKVDVQYKLVVWRDFYLVCSAKRGRLTAGSNKYSSSRAGPTTSLNNCQPGQHLLTYLSSSSLNTNPVPCP